MNEFPYDLLNEIPGWYPSLNDLAHNAALLKIVTNKESLTQLLYQATHNQIQHHLLFTGWGNAHLGECVSLDISESDKVWIREINWVYNNKAWVHARTLIPEKMMTDACSKLLNCGSQPIGEILFTDPNLLRTPFEFASVNNTLARRSIFHFYQCPLLVTEIFTSEFLNSCTLDVKKRKL